MPAKPTTVSVSVIAMNVLLVAAAIATVVVDIVPRALGTRDELDAVV